ncbi:MAG: ribosomal protein S18-alanine N-acetyltransferase [Clostridia bacterium]|jgi:ribosomal-protein-alanine N-acetyltransferase
MKITIQKALEQDVESINIIEQESFKTPWSYQSLFEDICQTELAYYLTAKTEDRKVIGYIGMWHVLDEAHITNVAVDKDHRKIGVGTALLKALIDYSKEAGIKRMTLEVRENNVYALKLYENLGFVSYGKRKGYYQDTGEDAVIMWKELFGPTGKPEDIF